MRFIRDLALAQGPGPGVYRPFKVGSSVNTVGFVVNTVESMYKVLHFPV